MADGISDLLAAYGLTPEDLDAMAKAQGIDDRMQASRQRQGLAQWLRGTPMPEGQMVSGHYVMPNPTQYVASALGQITGQKRLGEIQGQEDQALQGADSGRAKMLRLALGQHVQDALLKNFEKQPAPAEWNAPPGMTRGEASHYLGTRPKPDAPELPLTPEELAQAKKLGVFTTGRKREQIINDINQRLGWDAAANRPQPTIVIGPGGEQVVVNTKKPDAPAKPLVGPDGQPLVKPKGTAKLQTADKREMEDMASEITSLDYLSGQFKDSFAGGGPLGGVATRAYQVLGSAGSEGMQEDAAFWAQWDKLVNLPERNKIFGASLSAGEKASWEGARTIKPGSDPKLVRSQLATMRNILANKLQARAESLRKEGYDPEAISALTRGLDETASDTTVTSAAPVRKFKRVNGKLVEVKP